MIIAVVAVAVGGVGVISRRSSSNHRIRVRAHAVEVGDGFVGGEAEGAEGLGFSGGACGSVSLAFLEGKTDGEGEVKRREERG